MKIASWNVNSLNVRLPHLEQWLREAQPDVVGIQETKLEDSRFPDTALAGLGYRSVFAGQKTYNGVALLAREAIGDVQVGIPGFEDEQKRAIAATVGMVLRAIQERAGFLGRIVAGLIGVAWTLASFLVVPVLVTRNVGPVEAVKESALLLKKTWGENLIGQGGVGLVFGLVFFALIIVGGAGIIGAATTGNGVLIGLMVALLIVALLVAALVQAALSGIYSAALYRYAVGAGDSEGFNAQLLGQAFRTK